MRCNSPFPCAVFMAQWVQNYNTWSLQSKSSFIGEVVLFCFFRLKWSNNWLKKKTLAICPEKNIVFWDCVSVHRVGKIAQPKPNKTEKLWGYLTYLMCAIQPLYVTHNLHHIHNLKGHERKSSNNRIHNNQIKSSFWLNSLLKIQEALIKGSLLFLQPNTAAI